MKPVILLTHKSDPDTLPFGVGEIYRIRSNYCRAIIRAGGVPIMSLMGDAQTYADIADGVLFSGGSADINPTRYRDKNRKAANCDDVLDDMELRIFDAFYKRQKPMLGICRGLQLINVALGGTLIQDIPDEIPELKSHKAIYDGTEHYHTVKATPGSTFHHLFGEEFTTNSHHHQSIKECGKGLIVTGVTDDGVIETVEHESLPILATQWHPERQIREENLDLTDMTPLFEHFMNLCKK